MGKRDVTVRPGDWVEVKSPAEIARTLDADGTLNGLPFMPEMLEYCGKRFRMLRHASKTCVEIAEMSYRIRQFRGNDVVVLEGLRCSGASHNGCGRLCLIFWKSAWLSKVEDGTPAAPTNLLEQSVLGSRLKSMTGLDSYFCQSTELANSTEPMTRATILLKCIYDLRSGSRGMWEMLRLILRPLWRKTTYWIPRRRLTGELKRTPVGSSELKPGDWVEIKSADEIKETLDQKGRNRGLSCDYGMVQFRGPNYQVRGRLDRMISEPTRKMKKMESTVILDGLKCLCWDTLGGCPREDFMYWREIWLRRVEHRETDSRGTVSPSDSR